MKLLAPNGKPSNLNEIQYALVRTPEFKAWFGDWEKLTYAKMKDSAMDDVTMGNLSKDVSKVVDENGEPLVLHRGNLVNQEELGYTFNLGQNFLKKQSSNEFGFFFSNEIDIAKKYMLVDHFDEIKGGSITSVFMKSSNKILDLLDFDLKIGQDYFVQGLIEKGISFDNEYNYLQNKILDFNSDNHKGWGYNVFDYFDVFPELRNLFIENGFTSVVFYEMSRVYSKYKVFVAFEPTQIKLADGSNTTFDATNPDIRFAGGGYIGSCVDVGEGKKEVCRYFPDASVMAQYVGNPDEGDWGKSKETTEENFYKYVSTESVPKKALKGKYSFHYIAEDTIGREMSIDETGIFFIYNSDSDIHYFFKKGFEVGGDKSTPDKLNDDDKKLFKSLVEQWQEPFFRNEMLRNEIAKYEKLVKAGVIVRGHSNENATYYSDTSVDNISLSSELVKELGIENTIGGSAIIRVGEYQRKKKLENPDKFDKGGGIPQRYKDLGFTMETPSRTALKGEIIYSQAFKNWFGDWETAYNTAGLDFKHPAWRNVSKAVNENGQPLKMYHGTTHEWTKYSRKLGNHENDMGIGFYATSDYSDAQGNYLSEGKDLQTKISTTAEHLENTRNVSYERAKEIAERKLKGKSERVIEVYLRIKKPIIIAMKGFGGTNFDFSYNYDEETEQYEDSKDLIKFKDAFDDVADDFEFDWKVKDRVWSQFMENLGEPDYKSAYQVIQALKRSDELFEYTYDEKKGGNKAYEFVAQVFRKLRFDGVIYLDASEHFQFMNISKGAKHMIAFKPTQIKLADGTNTTFDGSNHDIRFVWGGELGQVRPEPKFRRGQVLNLKGYGEVKVVGVGWLDPPMTARSGYLYDFKLDSKIDLSDTKKKKKDFMAVDFALYEYEVEMMLENFDTGIDYKESYEKYLSGGIGKTGNPPLGYNKFIEVLNRSVYYSEHPEFHLSETMSKFSSEYAIYTGGKQKFNDGGGAKINNRRVSLNSFDEIGKAEGLTRNEVILAIGTKEYCENEIKGIEHKEEYVLSVQSSNTEEGSYLLVEQWQGYYLKKGGSPTEEVAVCNKLYKDHHEVWGKLSVIEKEVCESNCDKISRDIVVMWEADLKKHFSEEENNLFPSIRNEENSDVIDELISEHKVIVLLIEKIKSGEKKSDILQFCNLMKYHIKKEEILMVEITPDIHKEAVEIKD